MTPPPSILQKPPARSALVPGAFWYLSYCKSPTDPRPRAPPPAAWRRSSSRGTSCSRRRRWCRAADAFRRRHPGRGRRWCCWHRRCRAGSSPPRRRSSRRLRRGAVSPLHLEQGVDVFQRENIFRQYDIDERSQLFAGILFLTGWEMTPFLT